MSKPKDLGPPVLQYVFEAMQLDEAWSVRARRSFTWWGHHLAQRVWVDPARRGPDGDLTRVHAATPVLQKVPRDPQTAERIASLNRFATFSALVWNPDSGEAAFHSSAYLSAGNASLLQPLLAKAIVMQAAEAHVQLEMLMGLLGGRPAFSAHPRNGARKDPDPKLDVLGTVYARVGEGRSPFTQADFDAALRMEPRPWSSAAVDGRALTVEFPFREGKASAGDGSAVLTVSAEATHPQLGSGLLLRLRPPVPPAPHAAEVAGRLNAAEIREWTQANFFGAWCTGHDDTLWFATFLPAGLYEPGILSQMVRNAAARARWTAGFLPLLQPAASPAAP